MIMIRIKERIDAVQEELIRQLRLRANLRYDLDFCEYGRVYLFLSGKKVLN